MRRRRIRIAVITVIVLAVIGVGGYFAYARFIANQAATDLSQFGIAADQEVQLIAVRRGNLSNAVSVNGSLRYATRETFRIPFSGKVKDITVEAGDRVNAGDTILTMDDTALVDANKAYREAEVQLQEAQKALDELLEPPETTKRAATLKLENANNALAEAEADLEDSLDPDGKAQKAAQKAVQTAETAIDAADKGIEDAETAIETAEDAVDDAEDAVVDRRQAITDAENGIVSANLAVGTAEKAITDHDNAITQDDINLAQETLSRATHDLELIKASIVVTKANADASVRNAENNYKSAYDEYNAVWKRWLGIDLDDHEVADPQQLLTDFNINLESLFGRVAKRLANDVSLQELDRPLPLDDPTTPYDEQLISVWLRFNANEVVVDCKHLPETSSRLCILKQFNSAWDKLLPLKEALDTARSQATRTKVDADRSVIDAQQAIDKATKALNDLMPSEERDQQREDLVTRLELAEEDVQKAERQLDKANDQLGKANEQLEKAIEKVQSARDDLADAQDKRTDAVADLEDAQRELRRTQDQNNRENTALRLDIEAKQLDVDKATDELRELENPTLAAIELKRAELQAAQRAFDDAKLPDAEGEIVATFDGVIGSVDVMEGDDVAKGQAAIVIADPESVEMRGSVDEVDVLFLQVGDQAEVKMDAFGGGPVFGTITEIAAFGNTTSGRVFGADFEQDVGSVSYPITIAIQVPSGQALPEGLSASAQVVIRDIQNVLLVPVGAIFGTQQDPQLLVQTGTNPDTYEFKSVVLGVSDDFWTEVISGVDEGEDILMTVIGGARSFNDFGGF